MKKKKKGVRGKRYPEAVRKEAVRMMTLKVNPVSPTEVCKRLKVPMSAVTYWYRTEQKRLKEAGYLESTRTEPVRDHRVSDALSFLNSARNIIMRNKKPSRQELYSLLALDALEGT